MAVYLSQMDFDGHHPANLPSDNEKIGGEFDVFQSPSNSSATPINATVVWRTSQPGNVVSKKCVDLFGRKSWILNRGRYPQDRDVVTLRLKHQDGNTTLVFEFTVDYEETHQIVLGLSAFQKSERILRRDDGSALILRESKEGRKRIEESSAQAEARVAEREREKAEEAERRRKRRHGGLRDSDSSTVSTGSLGSSRGSQGS